MTKTLKKLIAAAIGILVVLAIGFLLVFPNDRAKLVGWARGETFHRGMPMHYWLDAIEGPDANLRYEAVLALGHDKAAIPALTKRLQDSIPLLREIAAAELSRFGPDARDAVPTLTLMLKDDDRGCRQAAADALKRIAHESAASQTKAP